ncbi:MAG: sulfotransferase family protein [Acidobacteriota bacterium]
MPIVVGVARSGTTLLRMIVDAHPQLAIPPETGFLPALAALDSPRRATPSRVLRVLTGSPGWPDFHIGAGELLAHLEALDPFSSAEGARCFYRMYAARFQKSRWGDKTPGYVTSMTAIERLLPEACFIHVIRDGRDVAVSLRPMWFAPSRDIRKLAAYWRDQILDGRRQAARVRQYVEVRYETLVCETARVTAAICDRLDLPWSDEMLRYHERAAARLEEHEGRTGRRERVILTKEQRRSQQIMTTRPPDPSRMGRWQTELSPQERAEFEDVAGDLLAELGYL